MEEILIKPERRLNDIEQEKRDKFLRLLDEYAYPIQESERIIQCLDQRWGYKFYNPLWFVSSKGYLLTVARKELHVNQPTLKTGGFKTESEGRWTDYVRSIYPRWRDDQEKGYLPQYYFYKNSYPKTHGLAQKSFSVPMAQLIALYFLPEEEKQKIMNPLYQLHHIEPFDWDRAPQFSNRAGNFQLLLEAPNVDMHELPEGRQHHALHSFARKSTPDNMATLREQASDPTVPSILFTTPGGLEKWVLSGLRYTSSLNPDAPVLVAEKNADGSQYQNAYYTVSQTSD